MDEITLILLIGSLVLFSTGLFVENRKPYHMIAAILSICSIACLSLDETVTESLMPIMLIVELLVFLLSISGAITRDDDDGQ